MRKHRGNKGKRATKDFEIVGSVVQIQMMTGQNKDGVRIDGLKGTLVTEVPVKEGKTETMGQALTTLSALSSALSMAARLVSTQKPTRDISAMTLRIVGSQLTLAASIVDGLDEAQDKSLVEAPPGMTLGKEIPA